MKNLLYIGNNLNHKKSNLSSIGVLGPLLEKEGFKVYYSSSKKSKLLRLFDMLYTCLYLRNRVNIVIIDTYSTLNFYYALSVSLLCRILKLPYIPSLNGGNLPARLKNNPKLCKLIFEHAYCCVSPSVYLQKVFEEQGYTNVHYIPNALNLENYSFKYHELNDVRLLWVRSFAKIYNPSLAIKLLYELKQEGISASLCMVGPDSDGTLVKVKELATKLNVEVQFTGKLTKDEWTTLAKDFNVFINTTFFDNMPVSVIEAMALGLPIVSTNVGGIPFLIENEKDGLLVSSDDVNGFSTSIKRLINQPVFLRSIVFNARKKVEQFDWGIVRLQWLKILS